jgi:hypothetical protein
MHPGQEQLNDFVDGALDPVGHQRVAQHLEHCAECALFVEELQRIVTASASLPILDPPDRVWQRIRPQLTEARRAESREQRAESGAQSARRLWEWKPAWALATAAAVVMAFLAGRGIEQRHQRLALAQAAVHAVASGGRANVSNVSVESAANVRERVLLVAVGDHLERSQMVLVELANAHTQGELDISAERQYADELLASNRLYRQTAVQLGQANVADLLDDLERVLVEVARGPSEVSMRQLAELQQRIEAEGILFKVKIVNSTIAGRKPPVS